MSPEVQPRCESHLPAVAEHAVAAIIVEVPSYAARASGSWSTTSSPPCRWRWAASCGWPAPVRGRLSTPLRPRPARRLRRSAGRGPQRPQHGRAAVGLPRRRPGLVAGAVATAAVEAGMRAETSWRSSPSSSSPTSTSCPRPASPATPTSSPTSERLQRQHRDRLALELLRGASEEVLLRRVDRAALGQADHDDRRADPRAPTCTAYAGSSTPRSCVLAEDLPDVPPPRSHVQPLVLVPDPSARARRHLLRQLDRARATPSSGPARPWTQTGGRPTSAPCGPPARRVTTA